MYCKKCGNALPDYAEVCDKCGAKTGVSSSAKPNINKMIFIPIGAGAAAVIALVVVLVFVLRPKDDIVQPSDSSVQISSSSVSQTPVIVDNSPAAPPASTPSSNSANNDSKPTEKIPDALSFNVNGVSIPVSEAGYVENDDGNNACNEVVLWGENSRYVVMAMINVPENLIEPDVTYTGLVGPAEYPLAAVLFIYDIENADTIYGLEADDISDRIIKIGNYSYHESINLFASGNLHGEDNKTTIPFSISGKIDYLSDYDAINIISNHYYEALYNAMNAVDEPSQEPVNEVVIAGKSYSLDTKSINLQGKGVTDADIENLKYLTNLTNLQLSDNSGITDLSALSGLTKLESLWLDNTGISDISPISGCKNLRELGIKNTKVKDISVISNFPRLKKLVAVNCNISDISSVANCPEMYEIWLSYNPITDFSPLVKLNNLLTVGLDNCCNMTWDMLETLFGLCFINELKLGGNGITDEMADVLSNNLYSPNGNGQWYY